jgi:DNA-binding NarL/FixJ family response regulator
MLDTFPDASFDDCVSPPCIRTLVVDDHEIIREALTGLLERDRRIKVVASACNGEEAVLASQSQEIDLVIMDLLIPIIDGVEATRKIMQLRPKTLVVVFSACGIPEQVYRALRVGARGYVLKTAARAELSRAVGVVTAGGRYVSPAISSLFVNGVLSASIPENPLDSLSARERDVLRYVVAGSTSSDIGELLSLSRKTIDTYRGRMMAKLRVSNRSALIRLAVRHTLPSR